MRFFVLAPLFFSSYGAAAASISILSPEEFAARRAQFQVVDARDEREFGRGHVPGSRSMPWDAFTQVRPGFWSWVTGDSAKWGRLVPDAEAQNRLRERGLRSNQPLAVLGDPQDHGAEGRAAWSLLYWGAQSVALVDGGYPAWAGLAGSKPETGKPAQVPTGDFTVSPQAERRALLPEVNLALRDERRTLLDARTPAEFTGERAKGQKRGGHLPRARLVPIDSLYDEKGRFASAEALKRQLPTLERPLTYCTGGVRSALLAMLLEARLGVKAANYDGSLWEYSADPELPLVQ